MTNPLELHDSLAGQPEVKLLQLGIAALAGLDIDMSNFTIS